MGTKKKLQNDAHFVTFNDMRAVTFVLPDEMADVSIALGLQWFILIPRLNHTGVIMFFILPKTNFSFCCLHRLSFCCLVRS